MPITHIDPSQFPELCREKTYPWGPTRAVFELGVQPPAHLISNINFVPFIGDQWLIVRHDRGWGVTGGTLEPGETYLQAIGRELREEAGARMLSCHLVGAWHCHSLAAQPYRPHLPWPEFYRLLAYGQVERVGQPENPLGAEQIEEVAVLPLAEACRRLATKADDGAEQAEMYRLVAAIKESAEGL